ncbi:MAG: archease [Verrucomicrobiae bacterium]|nr:archease [Verrucomicrobiae bacterium]
MKPYEFFEHTADIGVRVYGRTLEELFVHAAGALYEVQGRFELADRRLLKIELTADSTDELLVRWLSELLFRLSAENVVFQHYRLQFPDPRRLVAQMEGGAVNFERSEVFEEIKAVTYHQLSVQQTPDGWTATVIFDV